MTWGGMLILCTSLDRSIRIHGLSRTGGSSFVRTQQLISRYPKENHHVIPSVLSSEQLLELARKNRGQIPGSKSYLRAWKHWVDEATASIREDLSVNLPYPVEADELAKLSFELGVAADKGCMPSFSNPGARAGYALDYFCRARRLAGFFVGTEPESLPFFWTNGNDEGYPTSSNDAISFFTGKSIANLDEPRHDTISMISLGGGPGFDFVAVALMAAFSASGKTQMLPSFRATILDYEEGWGDVVGAMGESTMRVLQPNNWTMQWGGKCDITQSLDHPNNAACKERLASTDLWICQYCVAENAQKLRESQYIFFKELWVRMPIGSVTILTETTPRLWPEFYDMIQKHCPCMEVGFPNQRGPQLLIRKRSPAASHPTLSARDNELLQEFRDMAVRHEYRRLSGWERQVNKRMEERQPMSMLPSQPDHAI